MSEKCGVDEGSDKVNSDVTANLEEFKSKKDKKVAHEVVEEKEIKVNCEVRSSSQQARNSVYKNIGM